MSCKRSAALAIAALHRHMFDIGIGRITGPLRSLASGAHVSGLLSKIVSMSRTLRASRMMSCCPIASAAACTSPRSASVLGWFGSTSMAIVVALGTSWRSKSRRFAPTSPTKKFKYAVSATSRPTYTVICARRRRARDDRGYRRRPRTITILDAIADPQLFGQLFRDQVTWAAWCVFLCALFGLPLTSEQLALYTKYTGRTTPPTTPLHEAWLVCVGAPPVVTATGARSLPEQQPPPARAPGGPFLIDLYNGNPRAPVLLLLSRPRVRRHSCGLERSLSHGCRASRTTLPDASVRSRHHFWASSTLMIRRVPSFIARGASPACFSS
jgi:hypothetical protein